jgi:ABC-type phosphate transport system auxiliary subunit
MPIKDVYEERVQARIKPLYESLEHHEAHLESTESTSMESHLEALRKLKEKRHQLNGLMKDLKEASEHGWQHIRDGIDTAIEELKHAVDAARAKLHGEK